MALAGCGSDDGGGDESGKPAATPAKPAALAQGVVARVGEVDITKRTAQHWIKAARRQKPGCGTDKRCREQAMQFLVSAEWLVQEARRQGVSASEKEVRKVFDKQRRDAFPSETDYAAFLESSGRTEEDLLFQVRLSVLTDKLQAKTEGHAAKPRRKQRLETFVTRFRLAYKRRTTCRRAYSPKGQCGTIVD